MAIAGCTGPQGGDDGDGMSAPDEGGADGVEAVVTVGPGGATGFDPDQVEVQADRTVRWVWASDGHTITPQTLPEGSTWSGEPEPHEEGHVYEHSFEVLGPHQYVCDAHPTESGATVHVRERPNPQGDGF